MNTAYAHSLAHQASPVHPHGAHDSLHRPPMEEAPPTYRQPPASYPGSVPLHANMGGPATYAPEQYDAAARPRAAEGLRVQINEAGRELMVASAASKAYIENGRRYELVVDQQPKRARMCGFGDKDRRPITPPPCVKLIITDVNTGKEVDVNEIDHGMFVLNVDLWHADGSREVNLVRSSSAAPAMPPSISQSYALEPAAPGYPMAYAQPPYHPYQSQAGSAPPHSQAASPYTQQAYAPYSAPTEGYASSVYAYPSQPYSPVSENLPSAHSITSFSGRPFTPSMPNVRLPMNSSQPTGMFTRNLIGSLAASAFRLTDPNDRIGIWFVLQDLSVRTEGSFRLRFSFVNVGAPSSPSGTHSSRAHSMTHTPPSPHGAHPPPIQSALVNTGKAPVLASCFSEVFTVYSAKKFPGVVESTALSKCFATQGIKIPIRKDGQGGKGRGPGQGGGDEFDDDD